MRVCVCLCVLCSTRLAHRKCQSNRLKNKIWRPTNEHDLRKAWNFKYILASRIFIPMNKGSDLLWWKVFFSRLRYFLNSTLNNKKALQAWMCWFKDAKNYPNSSVTCLGTKTNTFPPVALSVTPSLLRFVAWCTNCVNKACLLLKVDQNTERFERAKTNPLRSIEALYDSVCCILLLVLKRNPVKVEIPAGCYRWTSLATCTLQTDICSHGHTSSRFFK